MIDEEWRFKLYNYNVMNNENDLKVYTCNNLIKNTHTHRVLLYLLLTIQLGRKDIGWNLLPHCKYFTFKYEPEQGPCHLYENVGQQGQQLGICITWGERDILTNILIHYLRADYSIQPPPCKAIANTIEL